MLNFFVIGQYPVKDKLLTQVNNIRSCHERPRIFIMRKHQSIHVKIDVNDESRLKYY